MTDLFSYFAAFIYCVVCYSRTHHNFMPTIQVLEPQQPTNPPQPQAVTVQPEPIPTKKDTITRLDNKSGVVLWENQFILK